MDRKDLRWHVTYNPYFDDSFKLEGGHPVVSATVAIINQNGISAEHLD
jgi:hypothetical protein